MPQLLGTQESQHGGHAPVVLRGVGQSELVEDAATDDAAPAAFELVEAKPTSGGTVVATYRPVR